MKSIVHRFIYFVGLVTISFVVYTVIFFFVSEKIIYPYEYPKLFVAHPSRGLYNKVFYPLRWFKANELSFKIKSIESYYGWIREVTSKCDEEDIRASFIELFDGKSMSIGFTGEPKILKEFDNIEIGKYVRLNFGVALSKDSDFFINKLISFELINLMPDPRIEQIKFSKEQSEKILNIYNATQGIPKDCANKFIENYQKKVLDHCQQAGYANDISGGCYHVIGYSINFTVIKKALDECGVEI